jgi:hypothetical protein
MVTQADPPTDAPKAALAQDDPPSALSDADRRDRIDRKGVIAESYRIDGIGAAECRSIFLDWVLSTDMPPGGPAEAIAVLLTRHGARHPDHPMTDVLRAGLQDAPRRVRRGGRSARLAR